MAGMQFDQATCEHFAAMYPAAADAKVFSPSFRDPIVRRGHLTLGELAAIVEWKSQRMKTVVLRNQESIVNAVTRRAFAVDEPWIAVWILSYLSAVSTRMASAVLTVYDPERFTVLDYRAWEGLSRLGLLGSLNLDRFLKSGGVQLDDCDLYGAYLTACVRLASDLSVSLRTLDRSLWTIGAGVPK